MNYIPSHLSRGFSVVLDSGPDLDALFERCRKGEAHIVILYACHEGRNGCYRIIGRETDGSAQPTARDETPKTVKKPDKICTFTRKQLKLWD